jgi:hypothetical protein
MLIEKLAASCKKRQRKGVIFNADTLANSQNIYKIVAFASRRCKGGFNYTPSNADKREARQRLAKEIVLDWLPCMD